MFFRRKKPQTDKDKEKIRIICWVPTEENGPAIWKWPENRVPEGTELFVGPGQAAFLVRDGRVLDYFIQLQNHLTLAELPYLTETIDGYPEGRPVFAMDVYYTDFYRVFDYAFDTGPLDTGAPARPQCRGSMALRVTYAPDLMPHLVRFTREIGEESTRAFLDSQILPLARRVMADLLRMDGPVPQAFGKSLPDLSGRAMEALNPLLRPWGLQAEKFAIAHVQWTRPDAP